MKILFLARHFSYLRNFESAIAELAERGYMIHLSADREEALGGRQMVERLAARYANVSIGFTPSREVGPWFELARKIRLGLDYLRFLDPRYDAAPKLRSRAEERAPRSVAWVASLPIVGRRPGGALLAAALRLLERGIPRSRQLDGFLAAQAPDVVLLTPLIDLGSPQLDHFTSARALGLRTVLCVGSWDHLSSKSLLRTVPDLVTVWNDVQKREAIELHGAPADRIAVTGAQCYDQWFDRQPSRTREAFCARVGLKSARPYLLWVCSSLFRRTISEARVVEQWIQQIRSSPDPRLREIGILVRPHPARMDEWQTSDLTEFRDVAFFGSHPVSPEAKDDYYDSLYYSAAVVGLNTSAFLEAAIVGRPVHTILLPEVSEANQEGTLHFQYLLTVNGGLLHAARGFDEHQEQLRATVAEGGEDAERSRRFVEAFIRPYGSDSPATPRFADAIEKVGRLERRRPEPAAALWSFALRVALSPWLAFLYLKLATQPMRKEFRYRARRSFKHHRKQFWLRIRHFAVSRLKTSKTGAVAVRRDGALLTPKLAKPRDPSKSLLFPDIPEAEEANEIVTLLGRTKKPIVVGPWLTETGFELLYWIPFVTWAKSYGNLPDERLFVVSRGGAAPWYRHITPNYCDILKFYTPDEYRARNEQRVLELRGRFKHMDVSGFDREIVDRVTRSLGLGSVRLLHPSLMYSLFNVFWHQMAPITLVEAFTTYRTLPPVGLGDLARHLPDQYVAAKFYANAALPDTAANRVFIASMLKELTRTSDVVLLNTGHQFDDHADFPPEARKRIHTISHLMTPENNLDVQTRIISGARAFVGTYGGFSYLAPLSGIDTLAFYSHPTGFRFDHLEIAKRVFSSLRCGSFVAVDLRDVNLLRLGFGRAEVQMQVAGIARS